MFMDDMTLSEVIETSGHTSGILIGDTQEAKSYSSFCKTWKNGIKQEEM